MSRGPKRSIRGKRRLAPVPAIEEQRPALAEALAEIIYTSSGLFCVVAAGVGASANLGCLGPWPFGGENLDSPLLDFLGFPWILSSRSKLINGLRWILAQ